MLLSFRYITDVNTRGVLFDGVWVDNITLNGAPVGDGTLTGWQSLTQVNPVKVHGFSLQLVGFDTDKNTPTVYANIPLDSSFAANLSGGTLRSLVGNQTDIVGAVVTYDEPTESILQYARYELKANGVVQPGG